MTPHFRFTAAVLLGLAVWLPARVHAQWGPETPLTDTGSSIFGTGLAATGDVVHLVYGERPIRYRRSIDEGVTWSAETTIGDGVLHLTDALAADGDDVWMVYLNESENFSDWCCSRDGGSLWVRHSGDAGLSWDDPVRLSTPRRAFRVSVAHAEGRVHVVWMDYRDGAWDTYYRRSLDRGATWEPETVIAESTGPFGAERPQVAARGDSVHVTIWDDRGDNPPCTPGTFTFPRCPDTYHVRSTDGGTTWGPITNVAEGGAYFSGRNDIAVAGASGVVINYNVDVEGETGSKLFAVASPDDGATWGTPVRLTFSPNASDHGSIIGDGDEVHLVWHDDRAAPNREIFYRRSLDAGASWEDEEQVSSGAAGDSSTPLDAVTSEHLHVIWIDDRDGSYQVYYRRRALDRAMGVDAGSEIDAGAPADAGGTVLDAGGSDVGSRMDTGGTDAGMPPAAPSGCACRAASAATPGDSWLALAPALAMLASRRRRAARST